MKKTGLLTTFGKMAAAILLLALAPCLAADSLAQKATDTNTVVSSGYSRIYGNIGDARSAALAESIRFAVQKAAMEILSDDQVSDDFQAVSRVLYGNPGQFVQDYRILRELQEDRSYRILVRATVLTEQLRKALSSEGLQTRPQKLPTVLFMVAEKHMGEMDYRYWWKNAVLSAEPDTATRPLTGIFLNEGFPVIDPRRFMGDIPPSLRGLSLTATPADYEAAIFARHMGAHLVVLGTAEAAPGENRIGNNAETYKGSIHLRVIDTNTGRTLTTVRQQIVAIGKDPDAASANAMADAAYQAGIQLTSRIDTLWYQKEVPSGGITVSISGGDILPDLEQFRRIIADAKGIASVQTMQLSMDKAKLWVDYKGTTDEMADLLLKQSYGRFGINITEISPDNLKIEILRDLNTEVLTE
ncbi:MAG: hypothetical protein ACQEQN_12355 [Thermodesulfobacteriota bacterium]